MSSESPDHSRIPDSPVPPSLNSRVREIDEAALKHLTSARITPTKLLLEIINASSSGNFLSNFRSSFFKEDYRNVSHLLDAIWEVEKGRDQINAWMTQKECAVELVESLISREFEDAKKALSMKSSEVSLSYIENWDVSELLDPAPTPIFKRILNAAMDEEGKIKAQRTPAHFARLKVCRSMVTAQIHHARSFYSSKHQIGLGLFTWSLGSAQQLMDVLNHCGMTASSGTVMSVVADLANRSIEEAIQLIPSHPHSFAYDNFHLAMSIFCEQRPGAPQKVQTGTFPLLYQLFRARFEHMKATSMRERFRMSDGLSLVESMPMPQQQMSYYQQLIVHVVRILPTYYSSFSRYEKHPLLQHQPRRSLPEGHKTQFYPLRICMIEEASVGGNIRVHDNLTLARTRSVQRHRAAEKTAWERRDIFELGIGLFHLLMNLIWPGTLSFFFVILEKKRLAGDKPDYHTLLTSLTQILDGLLLEAWQCECGSLAEFNRSSPSPQDIQKIAQRILKKYASPPPPLKAKKKDEPEKTTDVIFENTRILIRDLLYVAELNRAISDGDFGRVEDIFPDLARIFCAAGSNNYCHEILYFLHSLKKVWTPEFA
ncbi:hypothetical protein K435DRAFT_821705 [Dendrothele bispora CBS 962.96]|uniref:DUF6589 domain-containing protein n=2 Tax=Dendrothele bispora (strain CBS 962.96) TaxID=1314807 RepID=A0A4S8LIC6_DENBC|nr:hypothetical protein K435DRAFT_821705 [Dendrothele bispora CBS 962.96]